tara:strand:+ start:16 stop:528 length:513 start_codon:yes stop_codon:yes gene_type:complete
MKQKKVSFNEKVQIKEFRKNDTIDGKTNKLLENKGLIIKVVSIQVIFLLIIVLTCKLNKYDKAWSYATLTTSCLIMYFIINYNYKMLHFLHPIWVPLLTFLSLFLKNKYLLLESLWFVLVIQIGWHALDGCVLYENEGEWFIEGDFKMISKILEIVTLMITVILTYLICK